MPAPTAATLMGNGPASNEIGTRRGNRCSGPYAVLAAHACATGDDNAVASATTADRIATVAVGHGADHALATANATAAGATTRRIVKPHGRGANNATSPANHAAQSSAAAVARGACAHG